MRIGQRVMDSAELCFARLDDCHGAMVEFWYSIVPRPELRLAEQLAAIAMAEAAIVGEFAISAEQVISKRFFSSDLQLHGELLRAYKEKQGEDYFFSVVEQPPASGAKLALLGLCIGAATAKKRVGQCLVVQTNVGVEHIFVEHLAVNDEHANAEAQMERVLCQLEESLAAHGASIAANVLRTWIYAPHLDADYPGIVKARNAYFAGIGLTRDTHFIASTGIQGGGGERFARVLVDAYAMRGGGSIRHIHVPENMPATYTYGVAFERATAASIGPVDFLFISGTASIDKDGNIIHIGDVESQTGRTLENIDAVLAAANFSCRDLTSLIVYLRDAADYALVRPLVNARVGQVPAVYVKAAVCRPGWLVEIEATAARPLATDNLS